MKTMKRFGCLLLVLAMCLALGVTAMADSPQTLASSADTTGSITIDGAIANETYTIYQIFELTYTDYEEGETPDSYSYKVVSGWENFVANYTTVVGGQPAYLFTLTANGYLDPDSLIFSVDYDMAALARDALSYAVASGISGTSASFAWSSGDNAYVVEGPNSVTIGETTTDGNGYVYANMTFSNLSLGYYLVGTSLGSLCMLDSTDPDAVVNEKNGTPTIEKYVYNTKDTDWEKNDDEGNNSLVQYEITVSNINGAENLVIHDAMDGELSIPVDADNNIDEKTFGLTVTLYTSGEAEGIQLAAGENGYTFSAGECTKSGAAINGYGNDNTGCDFEVAITRALNDVDETGYIVITYYLYLDETGDTFEDDLDEIDNFAQLTFATSSESPVVEAEVYSFGFEVYKYTEAMYEGETYRYVITDSATYDVNAGGDAYCLAYLDVVTNEVYYAIFDLGDWDLNTNAEFVISGWTTEISERTVWDEGTENVTVTLTFYANSMPNDDVDEHIVEIMEIEGDSSIEPQEFEGEENASSVSEDGTRPLANAVFEVSNGSGQTAYFLYEEDLGIYLFEGWGDIPEDYENVYTSSLVSASNGMIYIEGLDTGDYVVTEVAAPDGYNMLDDSIFVTIWAEYDSTSGAITGHGVTWTLGEDGDDESGVVNVENNAGSKLPGTGGIGTTIFYVIGAVLVCGAVVLLVTKRRTNNKNEAEA